MERTRAALECPRTSGPPGGDQPTFAGQTGGMVSGRAITEGSYTFIVQVTDAVGSTDQERSTITGHRLAGEHRSQTFTLTVG